ncbi:malonyl-CoA O-methyltransferase [Marinimicrobium koreense]|uniref:Malonyl-[acyl-carrier protein] O-methyltransferase n=1 Tax=Marinimicrobium koreense TaxID=306545 RepID=A0A3N1NY28_9GAMM|nr:malonyl-ACP O-methyltransferase BioC [Marinimicrobium koreense]ROQ21105.1 malonyl-CoA O-methyltransferase [Marinimicrobium koreense]
MTDPMIPLSAPRELDAPLAAHHFPALVSTSAEPLVLLHGWGFDSRSWEPLLPWLRQYSDVIALDLPGFGDSPAGADFSLDSVLNAIDQSLPAQATLVGWSLGGMLAVALAARRPERITRVITLASNLRFVADASWPEAMAPATNERFKRDFERAPVKGLKRFLGLVAHGDQREREVRAALANLQPEPEQVRPQWGQALTLLSDLDNARAFEQLRQPGLHLYAEHDALVPLAAAGQLPALNQRQRVSVVAGAGHAMHWSEPERVGEAVLHFLNLTTGQLDKRRVAHSFSRAANSYDSVARLQRAVGETLLNQLGGQDLGVVETLVDLGCGTGYFGERLAHRLPDAQLIGLDIAEGMLRFARQERDIPALWLCGDAEELPLADSSVDLVFSSLSVQWCEHLPSLFGELQRVLKPGGRLLFSTLGPRTLWELKSAWQRVDGYVHVNRFPPQRAVDEALRQAGFQSTEWLREERVLRYEALADLTRELKALGAHNVNRGQPEGLTGRQKIQALKAAYEPFREDGLLPASYEVYYAAARKPH